MITIVTLFRLSQFYVSHHISFNAEQQLFINHTVEQCYDVVLCFPMEINKVAVMKCPPALLHILQIKRAIVSEPVCFTGHTNSTVQCLRLSTSTTPFDIYN